MTIAINRYRFYVRISFTSLLFCLLLPGCDDFMATEGPVGQIPHQEVFENEGTARAAVATLYAKLRDEVLLAGTSSGLGIQMGLYADELDYHGGPGQPLDPFFQHNVIANDLVVSGIWNNSYKLLYMSNAAIEGLEASATLRPEIRDPLLGEALFVRALTHFYLVNLFGAVPCIVTTDYEANRNVARTSIPLVYESILSDLSASKGLLGEAYEGERIRANKWAASALLARVYLYLEQWEEAESESGVLIENTSLFSLAGIEQEFEKDSPSAILQLKTKIEGGSANEATTFVFVTGPPPLAALSASLVQAMEQGDLRRVHWVGDVSGGDPLWYHSNKYRQGTGSQYSTVFRLSEQYLIRAEARARQDDTMGASSDLNKVRNRAGLQDTQASTAEELLEAIAAERRVELFVEHGHRWFDLRRTGRADEVLSDLKPGWKPTDAYLPVPESELLLNPNLNPQNDGY